MRVRQIRLRWLSPALAALALAPPTLGRTDQRPQRAASVEAEISASPLDPEAPPSPDPPPLDVRSFGARCDGVHSDAPAINSAIREAARTGNLRVYIPPGTCHVKQEPGQGRLDIPIRPEVDGLTLSGAPGGASRILLDADSLAILVSKGDTSPPQEVKNLTIRDLTFEVMRGKGMSHAGVLQLNHATRLHVADVVIKADGLAHQERDILMNGLVTSQGTTGLLERVVVDGGSKTGIYLAGGTHHLTVERCETANLRCAPGGSAPAVGLSIADAHAIRVIDHHSHDNDGDGLVVCANGHPPIRLPGLPDDAYGSYYPLPQAHGPTTTLEVSGGLFVDNGKASGSGIKVASAFAEVPRDIRITGAVVHGNKAYGVLVEAGDSIDLEDAIISDNGLHGVLVRDIVLAGQAPDLSRTSRVQVIDPSIYDNGRGVSSDVGGIEVWGRARDVTLRGGTIEKRDTSCRQNVGLGLVKDGKRSCIQLLVRDTSIASTPMPYGSRSSDGLFASVTVPPGLLFDCAP